MRVILSLVVALCCACRGGEPARTAQTTLGTATPTVTATQEAATSAAADVAAAVEAVLVVPVNLSEPGPERKLLLEDIEFKRRPQVGSEVTIIPLGADLPALQTKITAVNDTPDPCADSLPHRWALEIAPLTQAAYVEVAVTRNRLMGGAYLPFTVCVLYPAVPGAQALNRGLLDPALLPEGMQLKNVRLALDLNGDHAPDVLQVEYCCGQPKQSNKECDLTCDKTWVWVAGKWKELDRNTPC